MIFLFLTVLFDQIIYLLPVLADQNRKMQNEEKINAYFFMFDLFSKRNEE
jgi:hypothetical protein